MVIYTWEEMFPQEILDSFRKVTGTEVVLKYFEYNEDMLMGLQEAEGGTYDLVIADDYIIEFVTEQGLAQKLDKSKIPNLKNVNPLYQHQFYDPRDEYTVPYGAGIQTIVYDPGKINFDIEGFSDLWNPDLRGRVGITSNYRVIDGMTLQTMEKSYNETDPAVIEAAGRQLLELVPNIAVIRDMDLDDELLAGNIDVALMYTDQVTKSLVQNPGLKVVYPKEGIGFGIMAAFIPSKAPNAAGAHRFLDFILDPWRGADCAEYLAYYCANSAAEDYIKPELREYLTMPTETRNGIEVIRFGNFEIMLNIDQDAEDAHARIWEAFNKAAGN
ncbi:MAG: spermidine/putrescine ABC transporter substrate-binding protein [Treponema sp.]|nr:spermidine/putrescine ABC transporter substrate-binding protein [Treponema sp.]